MKNFLTTGFISDILRMKGAAERMIYNATQHPATPEQIKQGLTNLNPQDREEVKRLLMFDKIPTSEEMENRAMGIVAILRKYPDADQVLIGGSGDAPFFMGTLECVLRENGYTPVYAFFRRITTVRRYCRGVSVAKSIMYRHIGFVTP